MFWLGGRKPMHFSIEPTAYHNQALLYQIHHHYTLSYIMNDKCDPILDFLSLYLFLTPKDRNFVDVYVVYCTVL